MSDYTGKIGHTLNDDGAGVPQISGIERANRHIKNGGFRSNADDFSIIVSNTCSM
jgi:hypothetical protein